MIPVVIFTLVYLAIGLCFALAEAPPFDARTILIWFVGLDIRFHYWLEGRRFKREHARRLAKVIADRDAHFAIVLFRWTHKLQHEAVVTVILYEETLELRGCDTVWHSVGDGTRAAEWLEAKLAERWAVEWLGGAAPRKSTGKK